MNPKKYLVWIVILTGVIFILPALISAKATLSSPLSIKIVLCSVGCSVIAAAFFAFLYQSKLDFYIQKRLRTDISNDIKSTISESLGSLKQLLTDLTKIEIIPFNHITNKVMQIQNGTTIWWFNGAIGQFTRVFTLPELARQSKETNLSIYINIIILNPDNEELCGHFAKYRKSLRDATNSDQWDVMKVRREIIATIVSAYAWKAQQTSLKIRVGLKDHFTPLRTEQSPQDALITHEDPMQSAISYRSGSFLYDFCSQELDSQLGQCRLLRSDVDFVQMDEVNLKNVKYLLTILQIDAGLTNTDIEYIIRIVKDRESPYLKGFNQKGKK